MTQQKAPAYRWVILLLTFLPCFMMAFCQFQATPYAGDLMQKLSLTEQQYATIATAPMLVGVFLSFAAGSLADKLGVKRVVLASLVFTTVGAVCRAFASNYILLLLVTILMGVGGVVLGAINAKFMSSWFPPREVGIAIGAILAAGNGGTVLAMFVGKKLSADVSTAFLYGGVVFAVLTVLWLLFVKEQKGEPSRPGEEMPDVKMGDVLKSPRMWLAAAGAAAYMGVNITVSALLSPGLVARGVSGEAAGLTVIIYSLVALAASIGMPGVISRLFNTKVTCAALSVLTAVSLYLAWNAQTDAGRNVWIAVCGIAIGGLLPTLMSLPTILPEIGPAQIGAAGGLITTVMMGGAFLIPSYIITPLAGGINDAAFLIASFCGVILAVIFVILPNISAGAGK